MVLTDELKCGSLTLHISHSEGRAGSCFGLQPKTGPVMEVKNLNHGLLCQVTGFFSDFEYITKHLQNPACVQCVSPIFGYTLSVHSPITQNESSCMTSAAQTVQSAFSVATPLQLDWLRHVLFTWLDPTVYWTTRRSLYC